MFDFWMQAACHYAPVSPNVSRSLLYVICIWWHTSDDHVYAVHPFNTERNVRAVRRFLTCADNIFFPLVLFSEPHHLIETRNDAIRLHHGNWHTIMEHGEM